MFVNREMDKEDVVYIPHLIFIYIYIMQYYSTIKKNKVVPFAEIWMDLGAL